VKTLIQAAIQKANAQETAHIAEHNEIKAILEPLEGKPINGQTLNAKRLGTKFRLNTQYGMFHIEGQFSHLIGYNSNPFVSLQNFEKFDACHGNAAQERIEKNNATDTDKAGEIFGRIEAAFNGLREAFGDLERGKLSAYHFPPHYALLKEIQGDQTEIELSKFYHIRK